MFSCRQGRLIILQDAQADLSLPWKHLSRGTFSHVAAHLLFLTVSLVYNGLSSRCHSWAMFCDCGSSWTFLYYFVEIKYNTIDIQKYHLAC